MTSASHDWSIGLDFGTAFSKAAAVSLGGVSEAAISMLPLHIGAIAGADQSLIVPSAVFLDQERAYFGPFAYRRYLHVGDDRREMLQSFKMVLGAIDFEEALDLRLTRSVDPDAVFRRGDLIVLFLAYLLELIERAAPAHLGALYEGPRAARLRFSRPAWLPGRSAAADQAMQKLFSTAAEVRGDIGAQLVERDGVSFRECRRALDRAVACEGGFGRLAGSIYEASAAATCHFVDPQAPDYIFVADIGAGTTDFTGFVRPTSGEPPVGLKVAQATVTIAGDAVDRAVMNLFLNRAKGLTTPARQSALWRALLANVRRLKETLLERGRAEFRFEQEVIHCRVSDLIASEDYRTIARALADVCRARAEAMAQEVQNERARVGVVLAGGGAHLPFAKPMIAAARRVFRGRTILMPTVPLWANDLDSTKTFEAYFPQLCVAFGAALSVRHETRSAAARYESARTIGERR